MNFFNLETWQKGHILTLEIYRITKDFPKDELYGIVSQLRRATSSVTANIAEGFGRYHYKDKVKFYYNSRGSLVEVQNFLLLSRDLKYIDSNLCSKYLDDTEEIKRLINGLINSINKQMR